MFIMNDFSNSLTVLKASMMMASPFMFQGQQNLLSSHLFTYDVWKGMSSVEKQEELGRKNVIVTGWPLKKEIL